MHIIITTFPNAPCLVGSLTRPVDTQIAAPRKAEVLEQEAALEVLVGMQDRVKLACIPQVLVLDLRRMLAKFL